MCIGGATRPAVTKGDYGTGAFRRGRTRRAVPRTSRATIKLSALRRNYIFRRDACQPVLHQDELEIAALNCGLAKRGER